MSQTSNFKISDQLNKEWAYSRRGCEISVRPRQIISPETKIFAMGSCFAVEIRNRLRALGYQVFPSYTDIEFDGKTQSPGLLPKRDNINHYDTFVMRQEIELALDEKCYDSGYFWSVPVSQKFSKMGWHSLFQDPFRRQVFAATQETVTDLSTKIGACIRDGLAAADVLIFTLGLTECWRDRQSGLFVCMGPGDLDDPLLQRVEFHASTFAENYSNLVAIVDRISTVFPNKTVVISVSPVSLGRTWTDEDIVVANMTSKSTLRAVVAEVCRQKPGIIYWPSYEFAAREDVFKEDGRHVQLDAVDRIVDSFLNALSPKKGE